MVAENLTVILARYSEGSPEAKEQLLPAVYDELRKLAAGYMRREYPGHTLQATALVHEAYFRLIDQESVKWQNRAHFFGIAAQLMRRILIDHARAKCAEKRGGKDVKVAFDEALHWIESDDEAAQLLAVNEALEKLAKIDPRQAQVVELRYFGGLSIEETAECLKSSPATVKRDWTMARAFLFRELGGGSGADA